MDNRKTHEFVALLLDSSLEGLCVINSEGRIEAANELFFATTGQARESLTGKHVDELAVLDKNGIALSLFNLLVEGLSEDLKADIITDEGSKKGVIFNFKRLKLEGKLKHCVFVKLE